MIQTTSALTGRVSLAVPLGDTAIPVVCEPTVMPVVAPASVMCVAAAPVPGLAPDRA